MQKKNQKNLKVVEFSWLNQSFKHDPNQLQYI
jgi:hypothetical protein